MEHDLILLVKENKANAQKFINIPKDHALKAHDYVLIKKVDTDKL